MSMVQQNRDGTIIVQDTVNNKMYADTPANFAADFGVPAPTLPTGIGATDRIYDQGVRHSITDGRTILQGGPMPWTQGDSYITNIAAAITAQLARRLSGAPRPPP